MRNKFANQLRRSIFVIFIIYTLILSACTKSDPYKYEQQFVEIDILNTLETPSKEFENNYEMLIEPEAPKFTFDEADEMLVKGRDFAESYAKMSWLYLNGAAWDDYVNINYFDFGDKSENNYFEKDGIPFYKLLITDYTYGELITYIKDFYTNEVFEELFNNRLKRYITEKDNCIFVNGNEPTFLYLSRNEPAHIIGYTQNNDKSITYDFCARSTEKEDHYELQYFSFTVTEDMKLTNTEFYNADLFLPMDWINTQRGGMAGLTEPIPTNGLKVTIDELKPIIEQAESNLNVFNHGDTFYYTEGGWYDQYISKNGNDFFKVLTSFYEIFSKGSEIPDKYISSINFYSDNESLFLTIDKNDNYKYIGKSIFYLKNQYSKIIVEGKNHFESKQTILKKEFEITNRSEDLITLKSYVYYIDKSERVFEYKMALENGTWKFIDFEI